MEQLLDVEGFGGCGRVIHERLLALKHPGYIIVADSANSFEDRTSGEIMKSDFPKIGDRRRRRQK